MRGANWKPSARRVLDLHGVIQNGSLPYEEYWRERLNSLGTTEATNLHRSLLRLAYTHKEMNPGRSTHITAYVSLLQRSLAQRPKTAIRSPRQSRTVAHPPSYQSRKRSKQAASEGIQESISPMKDFPSPDSLVKSAHPTEEEATWPYLPPSAHLNPGDNPWVPDRIPAHPITSYLYLAKSGGVSPN